MSRILDYYLEKQKNINWYNKYNSTSNKQSGKTYSFINTNFRRISSFYNQYLEFLPNIGVERSKWKKTNKGQELDKHRVANLINAGFISFEDVYQHTSKGLVLQDWIKENTNYENTESWFIIFFLLLDYKNETREFDFLKTTIEIYRLLKQSNYDEEYIMGELKKNMLITTKEKMFKSDIFWLVTFARDKEFLDLFKICDEKEKNELKEYVFQLSKDKKTNDCIARKFISGGSYQASTLIDELKLLYYTKFILNNIELDFIETMNLVLDDYNTVAFTNETKIKKFIFNHIAIFLNIYKAIRGGIKYAK